MNARASVSVVVPCYRCAVTIERAVASVCAQTVLPAELILVDDGSGDETHSVLIALQSRYGKDWIQLISLDHNVGAASARNCGWNVASGDYVAFLDADDAWHPRKIEVQLAAMVAHPNSVISGHSHRIWEQGDERPQWEVQPAEAQAVPRWKVMLTNPFVTPSVMLRRDIAERFTERQRYMEDHMLWLQLACRGATILMIPVELAVTFKKSFGVQGLSAQFWLMERGDLGNYRRLYRGGCIRAPLFVALCMYSVLKYARRLLIYWTYLRWKK
jgi:glycosyltransferase involved in cell wall biosynthesis